MQFASANEPGAGQNQTWVQKSASDAGYSGDASTLINITCAGASDVSNTFHWFESTEAARGSTGCAGLGPYYYLAFRSTTTDDSAENCMYGVGYPACPTFPIPASNYTKTPSGTYPSTAVFCVEQWNLSRPDALGPYVMDGATVFEATFDEVLTTTFGCSGDTFVVEQTDMGFSSVMYGSDTIPAIFSTNYACPDSETFNFTFYNDITAEEASSAVGVAQAGDYALITRGTDACLYKVDPLPVAVPTDAPDNTPAPTDAPSSSDPCFPGSPVAVPTDAPDNTPAPTDAPSSSDPCFPGSGVVEVKGYGQKTMSELALGDKVLTIGADGAKDFSEVFMWGHRDAAKTTIYLEIITENAAKLTVSPRHFVHVAREGIMSARKVRVGDELVSAGAEAGKVVSIQRLTATGVYNPMTLKGDVVVDGFAASCYTEMAPPVVGHLLLAPVRVIYRLTGVNILGSLLEAETPMILGYLSEKLLQ
eukprot:CAMPEP_0174912968 /NCGR_PEP_ID=MMETSP0167-20121228/80064_1 /TAXON_ID=38298 /ORGANISM="Rhodella maculata, Strain CCMP736" /LENGTH=476 /DNA_ID=CAMNT_0016157649 /DNA_START=1 /DNA_END=1431 /DNA_ORIENTATION=-